MLGPNHVSAAVRRARLAVVGLMVTAIGLAALWSQPPSEAGTQPLHAAIVAVRTGRQLRVAVALPGEMPRRTGTLVAELLDPSGKQLAESRTELEGMPALSSQRLDLGPIAGKLDGACLRIGYAGGGSLLDAA